MMKTYGMSALASVASTLAAQTLNRLPSHHCGSAISASLKDFGSKFHDNFKLIGGTLVVGAATTAGAYLLWRKVIQPYAIPAWQKWRHGSRDSVHGGYVPVGVGSESSDDGVDDVATDDMDYDGDDEYEELATESRNRCIIL